jgi:CubicO group peptidase (beta-lactamase class C family)
MDGRSSEIYKPHVASESYSHGIMSLTTRLAVFLLAVVALGKAQTIEQLGGSRIRPAEIDATVIRLMKAAEVPGVGIAIINRDQVVYEKGYGFRETEKKLPFTTDTVVSGASLSKAAFADMVMQLVQEGRLDLDRPVYEYLPKPLPEYQQYSDLKDDQRYKQITARMLLDHTSGFPNWRAFEDDHKLHIHFDPGSRFAYSGEGMDLLQLVAETITKQDLQTLMQERVFGPLGMTRTSMVWQPRYDSDYANGYDEYGRSIEQQRWTRPEAAGSLLTSVHDFGRFVAAVMRGERLNNRVWQEMLRGQVRIYSKAQFPSLAETTTNQNDAIKLSYGLGWGLFWSPQGKAFFKEGHEIGERNYTVAFPEKKIGIVIFTNSANGEGIYKELLETLLHDTYTPIAWEGFTPYNQLPPRPALKQHKQAVVEQSVLEKYVGRYSDPVHFPGVVLTIRHEGDHLSVQENDEPSQKLLPESMTDFYSANSDDKYTFETDGSTLILHAEGKDIPFPRVP